MDADTLLKAMQSADLPGANVRISDTGGYIWSTVRTLQFNGQTASHSIRASLTPTDDEIARIVEDHREWLKEV